MDKPADNPPDPKVVVGELVGRPRPEPTAEDILRDRVGDGAWEVGSLAIPEIRAAAHETKRRRKKELNEAKHRAWVEGYEKAKKEQLVEIAAGEEVELRIWRRTLAEIERKQLAGEPLTPMELQTWKQSATRVEHDKERAMGRPTTKIEADHKHDVLHQLKQLNDQW